jgi:hypothetical protein
MAGIMAIINRLIRKPEKEVVAKKALVSSAAWVSEFLIHCSIPDMACGNFIAALISPTQLINGIASRIKAMARNKKTKGKRKFSFKYLAIGEPVNNVKTITGIMKKANWFTICRYSSLGSRVGSEILPVTAIPFRNECPKMGTAINTPSIFTKNRLAIIIRIKNRN